MTGRLPLAALLALAGGALGATGTVSSTDAASAAKAAGPVGAGLAFDATLKAEARVRSPLPGDATTNPSATTGDLDVLPALTARWNRGRWAADLAYAPDLLVKDVAGQASLLPIHAVRAGLRWREGRVAWSLSQDAARGVTSLGPLRSEPGAAAADAPVGDSKSAEQLTYGRTSTAAALDARLARAATLTARAAWLASGGLDPGSSMPLQWGPTGELALALALDGRTTLRPELTALQSVFSTGQRQQQLGAGAQVAWLPTRRVTLSANLGVSAVKQDLPPAAGTDEPRHLLGAAPLAGVGVAVVQSTDLGALELRFAARAAPFVDRFTGEASERGEVSLSASLKPRADLVLAVNAGGAVVLNVPASSRAGDSFLTGEAAVTWALTPQLGLALRGRGLTARQAASTTGPTSQWLLGLAVVMRESEALSR